MVTCGSGVAVGFDLPRAALTATLKALAQLGGELVDLACVFVHGSAAGRGQRRTDGRVGDSWSHHDDRVFGQPGSDRRRSRHRGRLGGQRDAGVIPEGSAARVPPRSACALQSRSRSLGCRRWTATTSLPS